MERQKWPSLKVMGWGMLKVLETKRSIGNLRPHLCKYHMLTNCATGTRIFCFLGFFGDSTCISHLRWGLLQIFAIVETMALHYRSIAKYHSTDRRVLYDC